MTYINIEHAPGHHLNGEVVDVLERVGDMATCRLGAGRRQGVVVWVHVDNLHTTKEPEPHGRT